MHLSPAGREQFSAFLNHAHSKLGPAVSLKLDSCWGHSLPSVPRLFAEPDCGAGDDMLSITSDKRIKPCSFHHLTIPFDTFADVRAYWQRQRAARAAANIAGCARLPDRGAALIGGNHAYLDLASVQ
jgi:hypothetical protein